MVRVRFPDLYENYQQGGRSARMLELATKPVAKSDEITKFEALIDRVQERDKCGRLAALQKAAREFPTERQAYAIASR